MGPFYGYSANLKKIFSESIEILQKCSLGDYLISSAHFDRLKNMAANGPGIFGLLYYMASCEL